MVTHDIWSIWFNWLKNRDLDESEPTGALFFISYFSVSIHHHFFSQLSRDRMELVCEIADGRHLCISFTCRGQSAESPCKHMSQTHYSCLAAERRHVCWHVWFRWSKSHLVSALTNVTCAIRTVDHAAVLQHVPFPATRLLFRCGPDADHQLCTPPYSAARLINDSCQRRCQSIGYSFWVCLGVGD